MYLSITCLNSGSQILTVYFLTCDVIFNHLSVTLKILAIQCTVGHTHSNLLNLVYI